MTTEQTKAQELKEIPIEDKLKALYHLQKISTAIDKIRFLRGELPKEVKDIEDEIAGLETRIDKYSLDIETLGAKIAAQKNGIGEAHGIIAKKEEDQKNIRNNREFEAIQKEIEYQTLEVELCEKKIKEYTADEKSRSEEMQASKAAVEERTKDLEIKKNELDEIVAETRQEEERLRDEVKVLEAKIEPRLLQAFKKIRKNSRNGLGIVDVQRDACGGCFNKIPPQRQLDIRMRKKIIVCEYCGRIMIDPDMAAEIEQKEGKTDDNQ